MFNSLLYDCHSIDQQWSTIAVCYFNLLYYLCICLQQVDGVGRLLFEMIKGVREQFHSSAEQVASLSLDVLPRHFNVKSGRVLAS